MAKALHSQCCSVKATVTVAKESRWWGVVFASRGLTGGALASQEDERKNSIRQARASGDRPNEKTLSGGALRPASDQSQRPDAY
jgi:hypothetical protein